MGPLRLKGVKVVKRTRTNGRVEFDYYHRKSKVRLGSSRDHEGVKLALAEVKRGQAEVARRYILAKYDAEMPARGMTRLRAAAYCGMTPAQFDKVMAPSLREVHLGDQVFFDREQIDLMWDTWTGLAKQRQLATFYGPGWQRAKPRRGQFGE